MFTILFLLSVGFPVTIGWTVTPCNNLDDLLVPPDGGSGADINFDYYIKEAEKLVNPLIKGTVL